MFRLCFPAQIQCIFGAFSQINEIWCRQFDVCCECQGRISIDERFDWASSALAAVLIFSSGQGHLYPLCPCSGPRNHSYTCPECSAVVHDGDHPNTTPQPLRPRMRCLPAVSRVFAILIAILIFGQKICVANITVSILYTGNI